MKGARTGCRRRSQESRRDESRARILAAAERVFARDGLAGARTDAIAADAGLNKALLYYYFEDKEKLYEAVLEDHLRAFNIQALAVLEARGPAGSCLLEYVNMQFDFISRRRLHAPLFQQLITKGGNPPRRLFLNYIAPRVEALQRLLKRGMRTGEFRRSDPFHTALSLAALVVFYFSAAPMLQFIGYADPYADKSLKRRKREVVRFVRHALFLDPRQSHA